VTHDGLTGPAALDVSGAVGRARIEGNDVSVFADFWAPVGPEGDWPMFTTSDKAPGRVRPPDDAPPVTAFDRFDADLLRIGGDKTLAGALAIRLPKALATRCVERSGVPLGKSWKSAAPAERRRVWIEVCHAEIRPVGDAGWDRAEVTSGGVPLADLDRRTLADRRAPRVRWCGETIHVTGRLGGFNFQWAWSSGFVAGRAVLLDYANASK
jgi:predicted flavoprotein YhiN